MEECTGQGVWEAAGGRGGECPRPLRAPLSHAHTSTCSPTQKQLVHVLEVKFFVSRYCTTNLQSENSLHMTWTTASKGPSARGWQMLHQSQQNGFHSNQIKGLSSSVFKRFPIRGNVFREESSMDAKGTGYTFDVSNTAYGMLFNIYWMDAEESEHQNHLPPHSAWDTENPNHTLLPTLEWHCGLLSSLAFLSSSSTAQARQMVWISTTSLPTEILWIPSPYCFPQFWTVVQSFLPNPNQDSKLKNWP